MSLALTAAEVAQIEDTAASLAALGVRVERWDAATCAERTRSRSFLGGVVRSTAGQLWPARLVAAIAQQALARGARIHTRTAVAEWTGIMGFTPDRAPLIGPLPGSPGEYVAAGFHGHGMPMAFLAAGAVAEMIAGKEPEVFVPEAFLPDRFLRG